MVHKYTLFSSTPTALIRSILFVSTTATIDGQQGGLMPNLSMGEKSVDDNYKLFSIINVII